MESKPEKTVEGLLVEHLKRDLILSVEEALIVGAKRAFSAAKGMHEGHLPAVVGQLRHFHMNEGFERALSSAGASPSQLRGNQVVTGTSGILTLARFNTRVGVWNSGRRSQTRREMSLANQAIETLVQPGLFGPYTPPSQAVAFFVASFADSLSVSPDAPVSIHIAVPDRHMRNWLCKEPVTEFLKRYDQPAAVQPDLAVPKLKNRVRRQENNGTEQ